MSVKQGLIFIIAAASGTGKTTLVHNLLAKNPNIKLSVSHTTRQPRGSEVNGEHYFFTTDKDFEHRIEQGEFLEYARVYDRYYGTSLIWLEETIKKGHDVLLEIDVQGAAQVREKLPEAVSIFILPPSMEILAKRLIDRQTDSEESIRLRLGEAVKEIEQAQYFDYMVVNDVINGALFDLESIVHSEHLKATKQSTFLQNLLAKH